MQQGLYKILALRTHYMGLAYACGIRRAMARGYAAHTPRE